MAGVAKYRTFHRDRRSGIVVSVDHCPGHTPVIRDCAEDSPRLALCAFLSTIDPSNVYGIVDVQPHAHHQRDVIVYYREQQPAA